jgi:hypothetical protein
MSCSRCPAAGFTTPPPLRSGCIMRKRPCGVSCHHMATQAHLDVPTVATRLADPPRQHREDRPLRHRPLPARDLVQPVDPTSRPRLQAAARTPDPAPAFPRRAGRPRQPKRLPRPPLGFRVETRSREAGAAAREEQQPEQRTTESSSRDRVRKMGSWRHRTSRRSCYLVMTRSPVRLRDRPRRRRSPLPVQPAASPGGDECEREVPQQQDGVRGERHDPHEHPAH